MYINIYIHIYIHTIQISSFKAFILSIKYIFIHIYTYTLYTTQLSSVKGLGHVSAVHIAQEYPTPASLIEAVSACANKEECETLLNVACKKVCIL